MTLAQQNGRSGKSANKRSRKKSEIGRGKRKEEKGNE